MTAVPAQSRLPGQTVVSNSSRRPQWTVPGVLLGAVVPTVLPQAAVRSSTRCDSNSSRCRFNPQHEIQETGRTSGLFFYQWRFGTTARFWTAAVLCRFGLELPTIDNMHIVRHSTA